MSKERFVSRNLVSTPMSSDTERDYVTRPKTLVTIGAIGGASSIIEIARGYRAHGTIGLVLSATLLALGLPEYISQRRMWKQFNNIREEVNK